MASLINIRIKSLLRVYDLRLKQTCTIAEILLLCPEAQSQTLFFHGKPLASHQSLRSAGVDTGSLLLLVHGVNELEGCVVDAEWGSGRATIICDKHMTVGDFKSVCKKRIPARRDIARISYKGLELQDSQVVLDCVTGFRPKLILEEEPRPPLEDGFSVIVKTLTGSSFNITINAAMPIENIHRIIYEEIGIPIRDMRLIYMRQEMKVGRRVEEYGISEGSVIHILTLGR